MALQSTQRAEGGQDGQVWAISGPHVVRGGWDWTQIIGYSLGINSYLTLFAIESTQGPEGAPDGKVWAVSGPQEVRGGPNWMQNDCYNFLLYPCVMKLCSKMHPWGCR